MKQLPEVATWGKHKTRTFLSLPPQNLILVHCRYTVSFNDSLHVEQLLVKFHSCWIPFATVTGVVVIPRVTDEGFFFYTHSLVLRLRPLKSTCSFTNSNLVFCEWKQEIWGETIIVTFTLKWTCKALKKYTNMQETTTIEVWYRLQIVYKKSGNAYEDTRVWLVALKWWKWLRLLNLCNLIDVAL